MDQWKDFAVSVALPGNGALPAANNDLTMGHIAALGPLLVILLLHPRKWFGLTFLPFCWLVLGTAIPFLPADLGAKLTAIPADPAAQGQMFGGDPFVLARLAYWYQYVAPISVWTPAMWAIALIGNLIVFVDQKHGSYLHSLIKYACVGGSMYITGKAALRLYKDDSYTLDMGGVDHFLDNVLRKAKMEHPTVQGEVSGTHVFFDVLMFVVLGVVHTVLEAPTRVWQLFLGPAGTLTMAVDDSAQKGPNALAGIAYVACGVAALLLWLPHQMQYGDKVWTGEAYLATRGDSQKTNADIEFCFVCTKLSLLGMLFTAQRIFAVKCKDYSFLIVQYWLLSLTCFSIMQLAVTASFVMAFAKLSGGGSIKNKKD